MSRLARSCSCHRIRLVPKYALLHGNLISFHTHACTHCPLPLMKAADKEDAVALNGERRGRISPVKALIMLSCDWGNESFRVCDSRPDSDEWGGVCLVQSVSFNRYGGNGCRCLGRITVRSYTSIIQEHFVKPGFPTNLPL